MEKRTKTIFWSVWLGMLFLLFILSGCIGQEEGGGCPADLVLNEEFGVCCPPDSEYNPDTKTCDLLDTDICPEGYYLDDNNLCQILSDEVVCPEGYTFDPAAGVCISAIETTTTKLTEPYTYTPSPNLPIYTPKCDADQYEDVFGQCWDTIIVITTNGETITSTRDRTSIDIKFDLGSQQIMGVPLYTVVGAIAAVGLGFFLRKKK